jgi:hypothetical protein
MNAHDEDAGDEVMVNLSARKQVASWGALYRMFDEDLRRRLHLLRRPLRRPLRRRLRHRLQLLRLLHLVRTMRTTCTCATFCRWPFLNTNERRRR